VGTEVKNIFHIIHMLLSYFSPPTKVELISVKPESKRAAFIPSGVKSYFFYSHWNKNNPVKTTWGTMWQHQLQEYKTELDVDGINQLTDTLNKVNAIFRFTIILRLCFMLIKGY
jgi:hypothetical protein